MKNKNQHQADLVALHEKSINLDTNEIYLHSHISDHDDEAGIDFRSAILFNKNFNYLDSLNENPIVVHLHTIGGSVSDGLSIYDTISQSSKQVTILGYAEVQSMSSIIFQAGDVRILLPSTIFMVHDVSIINGSGTLNANKSFMSSLDYQFKRMLSAYTKKCAVGPFFKERSYSESQIRKFIQRKISQKTDWYMSADEALYYGFTDHILGDKVYPNIKSIRNGV